MVLISEPIVPGTSSWTTFCWTARATARLPTSGCARRASWTAPPPPHSAGHRTTSRQRYLIPPYLSWSTNPRLISPMFKVFLDFTMQHYYYKYFVPRPPQFHTSKSVAPQTIVLIQALQSLAGTYIFVHIVSKSIVHRGLFFLLNNRSCRSTVPFGLVRLL